MAEIEKTQEEWQDQLTDEQYRVCRCGETEMPFSSEFNEFYGEGTYHCICCDTPLFSTEQQFNAGCGVITSYSIHYTKLYEPDAVRRNAKE